jgi:hypothetical protein
MNLGFYLTLMVGPVVAVPAPQVVMDDLTSVQIMSNTEQASGFSLTFNLSNRSPLHTLFLLAGGSVPPVLRVILVATVNGIPEVLVDGVVTEQNVSPGTTAGMSTLKVTGVDLTAVMDWIVFDGFPFPNMPLEARVALLIAKYSMFGIVPLVIPTILSDVPIVTQEIPSQRGTDLIYIRELAKQVGYVFYMKPGPVPGASVAYWGPEIKVGIPQKALNTNMDAHTNIESLSFTFAADAATEPSLYIYLQAANLTLSIPVPDISPLNPPLGLVPPLRKKKEPVEGTAKFNAVRAAAAGMAAASRSADAVTGTGTLDVLRYGRPLRARELVGVRGAGMAFDGQYYVKSVTHDIKRGEYKQSFTLGRNGLISTVPVVPA